MDCWNLDGKNYALIEDETGGDDITKRKRLGEAGNAQNIILPVTATKHEHHRHHERKVRNFVC